MAVLSLLVPLMNLPQEPTTAGLRLEKRGDRSSERYPLGLWIVSKSLLEKGARDPYSN